jgi:hypothetical protein
MTTLHHFGDYGWKDVLVYGDGLRACAPIFRFSNVVIVVLKLASEFGKCVEETLVRGGVRRILWFVIQCCKFFVCCRFSFLCKGMSLARRNSEGGNCKTNC